MHRPDSGSVSATSRANACRCRTAAPMISRQRASGARSISASTARVTSSGPAMIIVASLVSRREPGGQPPWGPPASHDAPRA